MTAVKDKIERKPTDHSKDGLDEAWVCIRVDPYMCPCGQFRSNFISIQHMIVVWPSEDDPTFKAAMKAANEGEAVEYEEVFGPCISAYEAEARGLIGHRGRRS